MGHPFTGDLHIALLEYVRLESQGLFSSKSMDFIRHVASQKMIQPDSLLIFQIVYTFFAYLDGIQLYIPILTC
jgi:hypothetical protein